MGKIESLYLLFLILSLISGGFCSRLDTQPKHLESKIQSDLSKNGVIKTFTTNSGDYIECVDIQKQPAFDHPLLKNHVLQLEPQVIPKEIGMKTSRKGETAINFGFPIKCPPSHIPIRKPIIRNSTDHNLRYQFAILKMIHPKDDRFYGASSYISVNNPKCEINQNSGASMWIGSDLSDQKNFIKAGWMVYPEVYGDSLTRFSIYWTGDGFYKTGCYDIQCPGFVQVNKDIIVGAPFANTSIYDGVAFENYYYVFQDRATKNWWLTFGTTLNHTYVGYWPKELFPRFERGATIVRFGGFAMAPSGQPFPNMGNGKFPNGDPTESNYFRLIKYVTGDNYLISPPKSSAIISIDNHNCYGLIYDDDGGLETQHGVYMGGPGGTC